LFSDGHHPVPREGKRVVDELVAYIARIPVGAWVRASVHQVELEIPRAVIIAFP
jgi:hypothetical protein